MKGRLYMLNIRVATMEDLALLVRCDWHEGSKEYVRILPLGRVLLAYEDERFVGWLRYGLFWDEVPFMNMLYFLDSERGKGYGRALVENWENRMRAEGYKRVMTSTQADESAQHFYRKLGYRDAGALILPEQAAELMMMKEFTQAAQ
jgi:GNAT superfamily N-acetyltransferase